LEKYAQTKKNMSRNIDREVLERTLIYFPIIHNTQADIGALRESMWQMTLQKLGKNSWELKANLIYEMWAQIEHVIDYLPLSYERVRLYQDGLPVCRREAEIVTELAKAGSLNHLLLLRLMERGATLVGTESSELLVQEYNLVKQILDGSNTLKEPENEAHQNAFRDSLLKRRGQYIADRINSTLRIGETGILFLGLLHSLGNWLDRDIRVTYPISRPFGHESKGNERTKRLDSDRR
jgi:hypothetical protein